MNKRTLSWLAAASLAVVVLSSCTESGAPSTTPSIRPSPEAQPSTSAVPSSAQSMSSARPATGPTPSLERPAEPLPKVLRGENNTPPIVSAEPVDTAQEVRYPDGVQLAITDVVFSTEDGKGPGEFPGRELALLSLEIRNGGETPISLDTVVVTVLDADGHPAAPMSGQGEDVQDFAGELRPSETAQARYAFAVPANARTQVTVVIDFDGKHTSAVFRGALR